MDPIFLLATLDETYLPQLQVMLTSLRVNNPRDTFVLALLHSGISDQALDRVRIQCGTYGYTFMPVPVDDTLFQEAPITRQYPKEMYYRLLAPHLLPKQLKRHGLKKSQLKISDGAIRALIRGWTREAGVRVLERELAALCRKAAMSLVTTDVKAIHITPEDLEKYLGVPRYHPDQLARAPQVGVVNGLAWTSAGGELLEVEVAVVPGSGKLELTGNLGDVMKESAHAALTYIRGRARPLGLPEDFHKSRDIHIHFPEGAVPKDGPSAGIAITTAMVSALTGTPVRGDVAMTGEITLQGRVLPIGGLKEKTMAAYRSGIRTVILPKDNEKDLEEIDQTVRAGLKFLPVEQVEAVLAEALAARPAAPAEADLPLEDQPRQKGRPCLKQ